MKPLSDSKKSNLKLESNVVWAYGKIFFKELEVWKTITKSAGMNFYWADLDRNILYEKENAMRAEPCELSISPYGSVLGVSAFFKEIYVIDDVQDIEYTNPGLVFEDKKATSLVSVPILNSSNDCIGVLAFHREDGIIYEKATIESIKVASDWFGVIIEQSIKRANIKSMGDICAYCSKNLCAYIEGRTTFIGFLTTIKPIITSIVKARDVLIYEMKNVKRLDVYYGEPLTHRKIKELTNSFRFIKQLTIAKKTIKVKLEENDKRITNEFLLGLRFKLKNLLAVPVKTAHNVLAAIQFVNYEEDGGYAMKLLKFIISYLLVGFQTKRLKDIIEQYEAHSAIFMSRLRYQGQRRLEYSESFQYNVEEEDVGEYYFYPKKFENIVPMVMHMFKILCGDLLIQETLAKFVVAVKRSHRQNLPFHNVYQSCDATNMIYSIILRNIEFFENYEMLALLISTFLYSIDYNGLSDFVMDYIKHPYTVVYFNSYKQKNRKNLGEYLIERTGLLSHLPSDIQEKIMKIFGGIMRLEKNYHTSSYLERMEKLFTSKPPNKWSELTRSHWLEFLVWCAYHSRHTNRFKVSRSLTDALYEEYYKNGDLLKKYGIRPKRNQCREFAGHALEHEIIYMQDKLLPGFKLLQEIFPSTRVLYESAHLTMENYKAAIDLTGKPTWYPGISIGFTK